MDNNTFVDVLGFFFLNWYFKILKFCYTTLNKNLVIGKFPIIIRMFMSFSLWVFESLSLWVFELDVWNDYYALRVNFVVWHNGCERREYGNEKGWEGMSGREIEREKEECKLAVNGKWEKKRKVRRKRKKERKIK